MTDENGDYLAGHVSVQDKSAYIDVSNFEISAHGCFSMSECYTTFGHELRHTSSANMQLEPGWFTPSGNKAYDNIVAPRYQENDAEKWGLWYSKQNGY